MACHLRHALAVVVVLSAAATGAQPAAPSSAAPHTPKIETTNCVRNIQKYDVRSTLLAQIRAEQQMARAADGAKS